MEVVEEGDYIPIANCHRRNDFRIKVGRVESHFNVSLYKTSFGCDFTPRSTASIRMQKDHITNVKDPVVKVRVRWMTKHPNNPACTESVRVVIVRNAIRKKHGRRSHNQAVSSNRNFRGERRAEAESNRRPPAYQPNASPLGQGGYNLQRAWQNARAFIVTCRHRWKCIISM